MADSSPVKFGKRVYKDPAVLELISRNGGLDPIDIMRRKGRETIAENREFFGDPPPFDPATTASCLGIRMVAEPPVHSDDAELHTLDDGSVVIRANDDRPVGRRNFSICHEIAHTFLPDYHQEVQHRGASRKSHFHEEDEVEYLCDIGAAELLMPVPWFQDDLASTEASRLGIDLLSSRYQSSRHATIFRFVQLNSLPCAAIFLSLKLKPTERHRFQNGQGSLFGESTAELEERAKKLRVDYVCPSPSFPNSWFIPAHKSIDQDSRTHEAVMVGEDYSGTDRLNLTKTVSGEFRVEVLNLAREDGGGPRAAVLLFVGEVP